MKQERNLRFDIVLVLCVLSLVSLGVVFIYSSGVISTGLQVSDEWIKQIIWAMTGLALMAVFTLVHYRTWKRLALPVYAGSVVLLVLVLIFSNSIRGSRAWITIGGLGIQPSEFMKISLIFLLAAWFENRGAGRKPLMLWMGAIILTLLPMGLVLIQPDWGTAMVYLPILLAMGFVHGVPIVFLLFPILVVTPIVGGILDLAWNEYVLNNSSSFFRVITDAEFVKVIIPSLLTLALLSGLGRLIFKRRTFTAMLYGFGVLNLAYWGLLLSSKVLREYQMMRLVVFLNPQIDPKGAGWHIIQSVTAVGSGGILGKGFLKGTQSHYRYLPEQSTDFIFSILAEETGFIGGLLIFGLFALILVRALFIAHRSGDRFGTAIATGVFAMFAFHIVQNIGMAIGLMPITGIPLFFLSYGGSSLWTAFIGIGLLLSIHHHSTGNL